MVENMTARTNTTLLLLLTAVTLTVAMERFVGRSAGHRPQNFHECDNALLQRPDFAEEPREWQHVSDRSIFLYSAFFDGRLEVEGGEMVRIIALGLQERFHRVGDLYCTLWYDNREDPVSVGPVSYRAIYDSTRQADMWTSHFVLCELPYGTNVTKVSGRPKYVSVTSTPCAEPSNKLKVLHTDPTPPEAKQGHAVCLPTLYSRYANWTQMIEMFELHRLLGASEITVYKYSTAPIVDKTLATYINGRAGDLTVNVMPWPLPSVFTDVMCQRCTLNDCYYRMRNKYKYISVHDLDEVLVPRMAHTYQELMAEIGDDKYGEYLFQHAYFRQNSDLDAAGGLITQSAFERPDEVTPPGKVRSKAMYDADKAVSLDLHFAYRMTYDAQERMLQPKEGMLHHYRAYPMENFAKHPENYHFIQDPYMQFLKEPLKKAVDERKELVDQEPGDNARTEL